MRKIVIIIFLLFILFPFLKSNAVNASTVKAFVVVGKLDGNNIIIADSYNYYKILFGYGCNSFDFSEGEIIYINSSTFLTPSYYDDIIVEGTFDTNTCKVLSSEELNLKQYYVSEVFDSDDKIIVQDKYDNVYIVEYGIGCLSMWRYEDKWIYIDIGGSFLDGISDRIYLFDSQDDCKVWDVSDNSSGYGSNIDYELLTELLKNYGNSCPNNSSLGADSKCYCNDGYKVNDSKDGCVKILCPSNSYLSNNQCVCNTGYIMRNNTCITHTEDCKSEYSNNVYGTKNDKGSSDCYCNSGYTWNDGKTACVEDSPCPDMTNGYLASDEKCYCKDGYIWDNVNSKCIAQPVIESNSIDSIKNFVAEEKNKLSTIDENLTNRLKGKILLQVENKGQAWYINPKDGKRHYMADGSEAYRIMRELGVGITNTDLEKVKTDTDFAKKHSGKIFLQVEDLGQAFYINFDGIAHYLKDGNEAYNIMRDLGLGITNNDLNKIDIKL